MQADPISMLIIDWEDLDKTALYNDIKQLVINGHISPLIQTVLDDWAEQCGLSLDQRLLLMTTAFPQRMLLSIMESKGI